MHGSYPRPYRPSSHVLCESLGYSHGGQKTPTLGVTDHEAIQFVTDPQHRPCSEVPFFVSRSIPVVPGIRVHSVPTEGRFLYSLSLGARSKAALHFLLFDQSWVYFLSGGRIQDSIRYSNSGHSVSSQLEWKRRKRERLGGGK